MNMRYHHAALAIAASAGLALGTPAQSKGCIRGAIAGGVVGHVAGHHALAGAAAGCLAGHIYYKHRAHQERRAAPPPHRH
jgi:hypothetical protein